jgi:hypothetical protein
MNELVELKITATVITSRYGSLGPGDLLRTDAAFARHLVEECSAARYVNSGSPAAKEPDGKSAPSASAHRRNKSVK